MNRVTQSQKLWLEGPAGRLQAILDSPDDGATTGAAVVCHPHPQHGGTMHNKVAHTLARSFVRSGFVTLRFNFRGTEGSEGRYDEGIGELDDALAALSWLRERNPDGPIWLGGFSFGAAIAVRAAVATDVSGLISVAPAIYRFAGKLEGQPRCPWLVIQGDQDELVDVDKTIAWLNSLEPGPELVVLSGAEHFFHGRLNDLRDATMAFVDASR
ncbi:MAG: alpha/beta fold hydrolase [Gammaproteobacteria bacterium]|nr:alpha/beta fold hydrolase [Gammaproteobacteria bacterium]MDH3409353.1 alpha/beta fold hydrolase [Gammaproteobacteria bacterium]MDH3553721.1 alpha/beta fold hydrolase [Gammaproteobacteria bacterium]